MNQREITFRVLDKIINDKQFSNIVLKNEKNNNAFTTQVVYGTLRNYFLVESIWQKYINKKPSKKIMVLLDMAIYELLFMESPDYSVINEAVNIAKKFDSHYGPLVNAVLRKINKDDLKVDDIALRTSHPKWLVDLWKAHYGADICQKILEDDLKQALMSVRVNNLVTSQEELLKDEHFKKSAIDNCLIYDGNIIESTYFKNNEIVVQSLSSQIAINALEIKENSNIIDICGAPGSKSIQMGMLMNNTGKIVANDLYDFRCQLIRNNVARYKLNNIEVTNFDGLKINEYFKNNYFDYVVLDAPCSGLGTLKHKPEIKITTTPNDLDDIVLLQSQLLEKACLLVRDKGILLYSTCTLNKKENEKQVEKFLKDHPDFIVKQQRTIFPFEYDSDGFYYAILEKR